ncbi:cell division protein ZapA [Caldicellulosiruptoraceae bacterium PP1]
MDEIKRIEVKIAGMSYMLKTDEDDEYILKLSNYVNKKMNEVMNSEPRLSTALMAVLASLLIADEYFKHLNECNDKINQIDKLLEDNIKIKCENEQIVNTYNSQMKEKEELNQKLLNQIEEYKQKVEELNKIIDEKNQEIDRLKDELLTTKKELNDFINTFDDR